MKRFDKLKICESCEYLTYAGTFQTPFCKLHKKLLVYLDKCEQWQTDTTCEWDDEISEADWEAFKLHWGVSL